MFFRDAILKIGWNVSSFLHTLRVCLCFRNRRLHNLTRSLTRSSAWLSRAWRLICKGVVNGKLDVRGDLLHIIINCIHSILIICNNDHSPWKLGIGLLSPWWPFNVGGDGVIEVVFGIPEISSFSQVCWGMVGVDRLLPRLRLLPGKRVIMDML